MALQLSVSCAEDVPWLQADPRDAGTLLGTAFVDLLRAQCAVWPRGAMPPDFHAPLHASQPALLLSGELDPVTPPRYGEAVRRTLPNSRHFTLKGQGHTRADDGLRAATADAVHCECQCEDPRRRLPRPPDRVAAFRRYLRLGALTCAPWSAALDRSAGPAQELPDAPGRGACGRRCQFRCAGRLDHRAAGTRTAPAKPRSCACSTR